MKVKELRQKYNGLLEKLIRLFTLSGIMFAVTACYGVAPYDYRGYVDVDGDVLDDDGEPLESIQVVIKTNHGCLNCDHYDTLYTNEEGKYHVRYGMYELFGQEVVFTANDTTNVYAPDTVLVDEEQAELVKFEEADGWIIEEYYHLDVDFQLKKK